MRVSCAADRHTAPTADADDPDARRVCIVLYGQKIHRSAEIFDVDVRGSTIPGLSAVLAGKRRVKGKCQKAVLRHSLLTEHPEAVVLGAEFALTPGDPAQIRETMRELMARRKASQPLEWPSAGSTFKRPEGHFAGTLIDQCGLKGLTVGGAQVSEKHAGFLINRGGATFADMTELIRQVQQRVLDAAGVRLEPEVKIVR